MTDQHVEERIERLDSLMRSLRANFELPSAVKDYIDVAYQLGYEAGVSDARKDEE